MLLINLIGSVILSKKLSLCLEKVFIDYNKITTNEFNFNFIENYMNDRKKSIPWLAPSSICPLFPGR